MLAKIWAFLWPPIDRSPIEPAAPPISEAAQPARFSDFESPANDMRSAPRVPPHQRYRAMTAEQRWSVYASFKQSMESDGADSAGPRLRAG